jgi:exonuclease VII large subunit
MAAERKVWTVGEVNAALRDLVEGSLLPIWVSGEVET